MKSLATWFCLVAATGSQVALAADSIEAYRQGNYALAASDLAAQSSKDPVMNYYLGLMRLYGYGELKNNTLALRYFTQAGESGYLPAQKLLANYYLNKADNPEQAFQWYKRAAAANDVSAQMYVAAAYLFGYGVKKNEDLARRYYIDAAKNGNVIAQFTLAEQFLASRDSRNKKMGLIWLTKSADKGNLKAQVRLGELYINGGLVQKDLPKAKTLLQNAADQEFLPAWVALGELAQKEGNYQASKEWLEKAANKGSVAGQFALANLLMDEKSPVFDSKAGSLWMIKAAQNGSNEAQLSLAKLYKEGKGIIPANANLAQQWEEASKKADKNPLQAKIAVAQWLSNDKSQTFDTGDYQLGGIYNAWQNPLALAENNYNQPPQMDLVTRKELYQPQFTMTKPDEIPISDYFDILAPTLSENQNNSWSFPHYPIAKQVDQWIKEESMAVSRTTPTYMVEESTVYKDDEAVKPFDYIEERSLGWEHQANLQVVLSQLYQEAILGVPSAQFELGQLYEYGIGVAKNIDQAITYYELAAAQLDVRSEYNLGILYLEAKTTPVDYQKGIAWLTDAAFKGNAYAQYVLANIYEKGLSDASGKIIVSPDHQQAMAMYYLASSNHLGLAEYRLADFMVKEKMSGMSVAAKQNRNELVKRLYRGAVRHGIAEAVLPLAFYNAMDSDPEKQKQAFDVAKQEAKAGNPEAALLLGIMYDRGIATPVDKIESMYWYNQATMNPVNAFVLGTDYSLGLGLTKDVNKGRELLKQSADAGFSYANLNLAILKQQAGESFVDELDKARQQGNSKAGLLLADYFLLEAKDPEQMKQASDIYRFFAEKGDRDAEVKLAFLYDRGLAGEANAVLAAEWYAKAAEQGQPIAQYLLGQLHQLGRVDKEPNYAEAKKWLKAAQNTYPPASVALGFIYDTVDNDYSNAAQNYQSAANVGDAIGQYNLGLIYENGKGTAVDYQKAKELYQASANQGYANAMTQLGELYFKGVDGQKDIEQAITWYKKAAEQGESTAIYQLGLLTETGVGTQQDYANAVKYYQQAADLGNDKAKLALARMYRYGIGVEKDYQHAADIFKQLAANNNAYAQYQLALMYLNGILGEAKPEQGKVLLKQASDNGSEQASSMLQKLDADKSPQVSYIEPMPIQELNLASDQAADVMYLNVLSEWNRGNEIRSKLLLSKLIQQFPDYQPAIMIQEKLS